MPAGACCRSARPLSSDSHFALKASHSLLDLPDDIVKHPIASHLNYTDVKALSSLSKASRATLLDQVFRRATVQFAQSDDKLAFYEAHNHLWQLVRLVEVEGSANPYELATKSLSSNLLRKTKAQRLVLKGGKPAPTLEEAMVRPMEPDEQDESPIWTTVESLRIIAVKHASVWPGMVDERISLIGRMSALRNLTVNLPISDQLTFLVNLAPIGGRLKTFCLLTP